MSTLAKVFVVIVLICSALLAASSATLFTVHVNYKQRFEAEKTAKETTEADLNNQLTQLRTEFATAQRTLADLTSEKATFEQLVADLRRIERDHQNQVDVLRSQVATKDRTIETMSGQLTTLERENVEQSRQATELRAQKVNLDAEVGRKQQELVAVVQERDAFKNQVAGLLTQVRNISAELADRPATGVRDPEPDAPHINSVVVRVDAEPQEFVVLSVGEDDGVKVGTQFTVYRRLPDGGSQFIGLVDAIRVEPEFTICRIQQDMRNRGPQGELIPFQEKDLATTHIRSN